MWIEWLQAYLIFAAKAVTVVIAVALIVMVIAGAVRQVAALRHQERLEIRNLNERFRDMADAVRESILPQEALKRLHKQRKQAHKQRERDGEQNRKPRVFVLNFEGDLHAHAVGALREEISAVLQLAEAGDEVLLRLESEGGMVHAYGLAASQLARIRARGIQLTIAIDMVAASGGYLMACVGDRIIAAPFAIIGSIGVIAQLPNFHRLLQRMDVDFELHTAGEFKRTLTLFGENTEAGRAKFREELEQTHGLFKQFVSDHRPQVPLDEVATGEHWYGQRALQLRLVDELQTSDDYLLSKVESHDLVELRFMRRAKLAERLAQGVSVMGQGVRRSMQNQISARWH
ncbi:protease SohB [Sinimarinibacterium sp. NLF-5-8]|uniref:protease SohB n=1 Tax=Sinimarinibacterium sp. NLF-5-8 TaxID=2698684 RepID=UPI00137BD639|nr:protease SohB [Sinimarinibacterium sp. NLF-5-8]QHS09761.1 protease SohB [Sinimarinibacterium sp. NLF-5-8]